MQGLFQVLYVELKKIHPITNRNAHILSHFVAKSAQHTLPLFKLLREENAFEWTNECDKALIHLKQMPSRPLVLTNQMMEKFYTYT